MDIENFLAQSRESSKWELLPCDFILHRAGLVDKLPQLGKASLVGKAKRRKLRRVVLREYPAMQLTLSHWKTFFVKELRRQRARLRSFNLINTQLVSGIERTISRLFPSFSRRGYTISN